jgi:hypothetical protein
MTWQLTPLQCFFIAIVAFGVIGFQRGWRREVISLAFTLTGILFLIFGNVGLSTFVYYKLPHVIATLMSGTSSTQSTPNLTADDPKVAITTIIAFLTFIALGYLVSSKVMPRATLAPDRLWGIIPGIISGYAILTFFTNALSKASLFQLNVNTPNQSLIGSYLLVVFIIIVVVVILALISASAKKSSSGGAPKK